MIAYPIPELCQGGDIDVLMQIAGIVFPDRFERAHDGVRVWVSREAPDDSSKREAEDVFRTALGALRA